MEIVADEVGTVPALLIADDGLHKMIRIPENTEYEVQTQLDNGRHRIYSYVGHYDGTFSRNQSQIIRVYKEQL